MNYSVKVIPLYKLPKTPYFWTVNSLMEEVGAKPYNNELVDQLTRNYTGQHTYFIIMCYKDEVIGVCRLYPSDEKRDIYRDVKFKSIRLRKLMMTRSVCYLSRFVIAPKFRRKGYGAALMHTVIKNVHRLPSRVPYTHLALFVARKNLPAFNLYKKVKFDVIGLCDTDGYDDHLMLLDLPGLE